MDIPTIARLVKELALEIGCNRHEILHNLVGMVLSEEEVSEIQEAFNK
jgi:hypothetical protein